MRLEKPVDVSGFQIRHACLPSRSKPFTSESKCWIMGWGETKGKFKINGYLPEELLNMVIRWPDIINTLARLGGGGGGCWGGREVGS